MRHPGTVGRGLPVAAVAQSRVLVRDAAVQPFAVAVQQSSRATGLRLRDHSAAAARAQLGRRGHVHAHLRRRQPGRSAEPEPTAATPMRAGLRQLGPAHHGRRQLCAVADRGGAGRRDQGGATTQARPAVQSDAAAPGQVAAPGRRRWDARSATATVGVASVSGPARFGGAQRVAPELLAAGGDGRAQPEQLGAQPGGHA